MSKKSRIAGVLLVIAVAAFFRIWHLEALPPGLFSDEAMNGNNLHQALRTGDYKVFYRENNGREGLFINLQAISVALLGHTAFALRLMAALFGIGTVIALYFFANAYTQNSRIALLASFLAAAGFWPVLLSRLGFRANMAPFFLTASLWLLYAAWNRRNDKNHAIVLLIAIMGGLLFGLGFHSYIAYRIAPTILVPAFLLFVREALRKRDQCIICVPAVFALGAFIAIIPLILYFAEYPNEFFGRTSQISVFSQERPIVALAENTAKTLQMFYFVGDLNWRHNFRGEPALWWPVAIMFTAGIAVAAARRYWTLFLWFGAMLLPVVLSSEGIPHALRAIVLIPPVFLFAGIGFDFIIGSIERAIRRFAPSIEPGKMIAPLIAFLLAAQCTYTYQLYFVRWATRPEVGASFQQELYAIGLYLNSLPLETPKYVITDEVDSIDVTGRPMALQPILFATETYLPEPPGTKNIRYLALNDISLVQCDAGCVLIPLGNKERVATELRARIDGLATENRDGFLVLSK